MTRPLAVACTTVLALVACGCPGGRIVRTDADAVPNAAAMLRLALDVFASGQGADAAAAAPLYVRDKVALKTSER